MSYWNEVLLGGVILGVMIFLWKLGYEWWKSRGEPVWADSELERLHGELLTASKEHGRKVKSGELTAEDFTADFEINVMPAIRAWEKAIFERMNR